MFFMRGEIMSGQFIYLSHTIQDKCEQTMTGSERKNKKYKQKLKIPSSQREFDGRAYLVYDR